MKYNTLNSICNFFSEKTQTHNLTLNNYISTENMLQNKGGVTKSSGLPTTAQTQAFETGDVLVSNIRPYFKKIWLADGCGGCSNDVLVLRAKENTSSEFLYYILSDDVFFDYATKTSKGTKMPRGDKKAIMIYEVPVVSSETQKQIAQILSSIDDKIELNNKINDNLEQQAQAIFKSWFVDFEPFGGVMPADWVVGIIGDVIQIHDSKRIPLSSSIREKMTNKTFPYYGAASLMDYVENYIFDGTYLLLGEDGTVVDSQGYPILQYVWGKFWVNNHAHILTGKNGFNVESLYLLFKQTPVKSVVTGAVQPKISQVNLKSIETIIPKLDVLNKFNQLIDPLFLKIKSNKEEVGKLTQLRDTLLPKLMSGEIDVSQVEI